jgi:hypothetical protein
MDKEKVCQCSRHYPGDNGERPDICQSLGYCCDCLGGNGSIWLGKGGLGSSWCFAHGTLRYLYGPTDFINTITNDA